MKRKLPCLIIALLFFAKITQAQWVQTNGPFGGTVYALATNSEGDIFAGTYNNGLFRSTDGGVNWTKLVNLLTDAYVRTLAINNNGDIFAGTAGTSNSGVFISTDNGDSWTQVEKLGNNQVSTIVIGKNGEIFVVNGAIFKSTDNGNTWSSISDSLTSGQVTTFAINNNGDYYAEVYNDVYESGSLYRSTDSGRNWKQLPVSGSQIVTNNSGYVFICSGDNYGAGGVYRSTDNGNSWTHVYSGNPVASLIIDAKGDVIAGSWENGIFRSTNEGTTWMQTNLTNGEIISLATDTGGNIFAGANTIGAFKSTDNGSNWSKMGIRNSSIYALILNKSGDIFAGTYGDGAYRSTDNGNNWVQINNGGLIDKDIYSFAINSNGNIFAGTGVNNVGVYRSTDNGNNWTLTGLTNSYVPALAINNSGYIFAGSDGVYRSTDNGNNWTKVYSPPNNNAITSLAINNGGYIFAGGVGLYLSVDNGENWVQIGLANTAINSVAINSNGDIFAGSQDGIYRSTDDGNNWFQIGLINIRVTSIITYGKEVIFAGTSNGGIYCSTDNGNTWIQKDKGLTNSNINSLVINNKDESIYAGSIGSGVWRRPLSELVTLYEVYPIINLSTASINSGQSITISGSNFTRNSSANLTISGPDTSFTLNIPTGQNGNISKIISLPHDALQGTYSVIVSDVSSGKVTTTKYFYVTHEQIVSQMKWIASPTDTILAGNDFQIQWKDLMTKNSSYQIVGATRQYSYNIDISSDGGTSWSYSKTIKGGGIVYNWANINATLNISNSGNYEIRIVDKNVPSRILVSNEFYVVQPIVTNVKTGLAWDFSYSSPPISPPIGVVADGVSRIYLTLSSTKSISQLKVTLSNNEGSSDSKILGKVIDATVTGQYSDEANSATQISTIISTPNHGSAYWIWYVAPGDFVYKNWSDKTAPSRTVWANFQISFTDGSSGSQRIPIKIVRPPLLLVNGIGDVPTTWDNLRNYIDNNSPFPIIYPTTIANSTSFHLGAGDVDEDIKTVVQRMHNLNYACSQVECIGHSTGGDYLRAFSDMSSTYLQQKNYYKGYFNKAIFLDTPNQGTPVSDLLVNSIDYLNTHTIAHVALDLIYGDTQFLSNPLMNTLIKAEGNSSFLEKLGPTDVLEDSKTISNGGYKFNKTVFPVHLVGSDFFAGAQNLPAVPPEVWTIISSSEDYLSFIDKISDVLVFINPPAEGVAKGIIETAKRALTILDYSLKLYSGVSFILDSDWLVSVNSQIAELNREASNVSIFNNLTHFGNSFSSVTSNYAVFSLIDSLVDVDPSNSTYNILPSNYSLSKENFAANQRSSRNILLGIKRNNIRITSISDSTNVLVDSTLDVNFNLQDTVGFQYVKVFFQGKSYLSYDKTFGHEFTFQVSGTYINEQPLEILAVYFKNDSTIWSYKSDTLNVKPSSPIQKFFIEPKVIEISAGQSYSPVYIAIYKTFLSKISSNNPDLKFTVADPNIISINKGTNFIQGESKGETSIIVSYNGIPDTLYAAVDDSITTGIKETKNIKTTPQNFNLSQNYPNPFNPTTLINYSVPKTCLVTIRVYDILGREVKTLVNEEQPAGNYSVQFNGVKLASGVYFYRMQAGNFVETKKLILLK